MKILLSMALAITLFNCGSQKDTSETNNASEISSSVVTLALKENVKSSLEYLASDELEGRHTGSKGIEKAAVFIEDFFKENNIKPYFETYRDSFNLNSIVGYNVVGYIEGHDPELKNEFVILGAHYDHIGTAEPVNGDSIANGANDDASGTVAVLEWAKYFSKSKSNKRSLLFTLYAAEEMGLKGSGHLAKRLKGEALNLYTMINFEMIGVPRAENETIAYLTGYKKSNMAEKLNSYVKEDIVGFLPQAKEYNLFKRSDNYPFFNAFQIPAQAISTFDFTNFDYYHHVDDEADKMDFEHMTSFINKMIPALEGMTNASTKEIKMNNE
ncbi:M20/M25/M40 family metallo-hydrolase [Flavivirga amylovorans]|uniref:M20/M25/M40 family metallo-hydrolase n=1 Tax=Flavivirga amylovorans TaxID=870486 RepID=A0ABT8WW92_9FLAO|nr:M20/M25/M40 family metallo-hydrolase [Flavivirga amylovorans]MDO5985933.1 M20/M25/M40 family metallo-hydrolase [Flavivirga amylovorans]